MILYNIIIGGVSGKLCPVGLWEKGALLIVVLMYMLQCCG